MSSTEPPICVPCSPRNIPAEIVDLCVEALVASINPKANVNQHLAGLLSVSRSFRYSAIKRVFREVTLWYHHGRRQQEAPLLHDVLKGDPDIQRHIRKLTIVFNRDYHRFYDIFPPESESINCSDFIALLHLFSKAPLTHVSIEGQHWRYLHMDQLSSSGIEALMALRCNPLIVSFAFSELDMIPSMLITGPSKDTIRSLQLRGTEYLGPASKLSIVPFTLDGDGDGYPFLKEILENPQQCPFQNLRVLALDRPSQFPFQLCRSLEEADASKNAPSEDFVFRSLEVLVVGNTRNKEEFTWLTHDDDHLAITNLVKRAPNLHTLDFIYRLALIDNGPSSPERYRFLKHAHKPLKFRIADIVGSHPRRQLMAAAARLLEVNSPLDKVSTFFLGVVWRCLDEDELRAYLEPSQGWGTLVSALNNVPSLRKVTLHIGFWVWKGSNTTFLDEDRQEEVRGVVEENLKGIGKGVVVGAIVDFPTSDSYPFSYMIPEPY